MYLDMSEAADMESQQLSYYNSDLSLTCVDSWQTDKGSISLCPIKV